MREINYFCSIIVFAVGVYLLLLIQLQIYKFNWTSNNDPKEKKDSCSNIKSKFSLKDVDCGSAGRLLALEIQNCSELPCDILPSVNYSAELYFAPSRNIALAEVHTFIQPSKTAKHVHFLHKETVLANAVERHNTTFKFSFAFPSAESLASRFNAREIPRKCPHFTGYQLGMEIWDVATNIGEICLVIPMNVYFNKTQDL